MTYRDDDEAARARADALQRDLDDTQDELAEAREQLAAAEAEKARLAEEVAEVRARLPEPGPEPEPPRHRGQAKPDASAGLTVLVLAVGAIVFALIAVGVSRARTRARQEPPNPTCTLRTNPPGASIYGICKSDFAMPTTFEMGRGTTPLSQSRQEWIMDDVICKGTMVARLPGYVDTPVSSPLVGMGCDETVVQLRATAE